ncbi:glycine betaine ABC transporter substrate-binding protein [Petroclostridium sp. X23]|uniref:glycine betaine ABC transporter substrate-binding protein n=1 Tax=Petroclostridium sp. X23 TaxID=3045146 RepID=UPI0024AE6C5B|nr:glycine betaine ABC transporter substrate-binding protein [Petroclostridium sp. X23]WHH58000.1 glycine betaine ABC transporter substrate-binding protein [Petroclostridium sp. X23]
MFNKKKLSVMICLLLVVGLFAGCSGAGDKTVVIGSKDFTENIILGEMIAQMLEAKTDLKVERKLNMGGTFVNFEALKKGDIDMYADYTGTGLTAQLKMDVINDADKVYDIVQEEFNKQFKLKWLKPFGFNNTYAVAVKEDFANENNVNKVSDLVPLAQDLVFGAEHEFFNRQDGYDGMIEKYGLKFKDVAKMQVALKYQAIGQGKMDVTDAFATDGQLITYKLKVLEDDKGFFPPYYAAPVVRMDTLEAHPEIEEVLNQLGDQISDDEMQQMNYQADSEGVEIEKVVSDFLKSKGLID